MVVNKFEVNITIITVLFPSFEDVNNHKPSKHMQTHKHDHIPVQIQKKQD